MTLQHPKTKIPRKNPKFGALGASHKELLHNDPKSKMPKIRLKKFGFGFRILDWGLWILGRSRGFTTRQFNDGASRSEARIPLGPPLMASAKPTVSDTVGQKEQTWLEKHGEKEVKIICFTISRSFCVHLGYLCQVDLKD